jgi:GT2 family glycosyltransferase
MGRVDAPKISVLVTCYNLGQYLDEAIDSVFAQTCDDFEIVIVDDGSTDRQTCDLIATYRRPRTRVIRTPHQGLARARNLAIANSSGRYLCALDADDRLEPAFLSRTASVLDADSSVTFVSSWLRTFGDEQWAWKPERCDLPSLLWEDTILTAALVRRDAVIGIGGYDEHMPVQGDEDWDLWLRLVARGRRGVILPAVLFNYRRRAGSMSTICWLGAGHVPLADYRFVKHRETYVAHLTDVLLHQDEETAALLRANDRLERFLAGELEPSLEWCRGELATLRSRLADPQPALAALDAPTAGDDRPAPAPRPSTGPAPDRVAELEAAAWRLAAEVSALKRSMSWRVTAPLRAAYECWLRWRRPQT